MQYVTINVANDTGKDAVYFGIAICPADMQVVATHYKKGEKPHRVRDVEDADQVFLPIGRDVGDLEEIRGIILQQVNRVFDAAQNKGEFA